MRDDDPIGLYFSRFLHQDWMYEFASLDATFDELLAILDIASIEHLLVQIAELLALDADELDRQMRRRSPDLNPPQDLGISDAEWLQSLHRRAAAELVTRI